MKLVVGIGNPGKQYEGTRHNVGYMVLDELARRHGETITRSRFRGLVAEVGYGADKLLLLKPITYVNLSGQSVVEAMRYYDLEVSQLLVVCDDVNLQPGVLRLRRGGSSGGHNGLKSIAGVLGSTDYPRCRLGVGRGRGDGDLKNHVLDTFDKHERETMNLAVTLAADATELWSSEGIEAAMNRYNGSVDAEDD